MSSLSGWVFLLFTDTKQIIFPPCFHDILQKAKFSSTLRIYLPSLKGAPVKFPSRKHPLPKYLMVCFLCQCCRCGRTNQSTPSSTWHPAPSILSTYWLMTLPESSSPSKQILVSLSGSSDDFHKQQKIRNLLRNKNKTPVPTPVMIQIARIKRVSTFCLMNCTDFVLEQANTWECCDKPVIFDLYRPLLVTGVNYNNTAKHLHVICSSGCSDIHSWTLDPLLACQTKEQILTRWIQDFTS